MMYSCSHPSMQTTIVDFDGNRYVLLLTVIEFVAVVIIRHVLVMNLKVTARRYEGVATVQLSS